jgi:glycosyltransferase involved in cell wall biosynthesis
LVALLKRERIDLLNAHHFLHAGITAFHDVTAAGIEIVFTIHEFLAICHNHGQMITRGAQLLCEAPSPSACHACYPEHTRQQFAVRSHVVGKALDEAAAFVSPSHFLADRMSANGLDAAKMHVIENGILQREPAPAIVERGEEHIWKYGFFGQINPFKGMDTMLGACAIIARDPDVSSRVRIMIHGNFVGQSEAFIERFMAACEEYPFLSYLGPYDNRIVGRLMGACDYVMAPSTWWENSPVVIQEAYHARRPVICTGIGGMAEKVVDHVTGLHFTRNDPGDLAARIVEGADPALYRTLQENIPAAGTPVSMAEDYLALFEQIVTKEPAAAA